MQSSFYSLAQLTTAFAWGLVSDRYGRKQLIVMSNLFSTISMLMFGLAGNYVMAALSRAIGGWCVISDPAHDALFDVWSMWETSKQVKFTRGGLPSACMHSPYAPPLPQRSLQLHLQRYKRSC